MEVVDREACTIFINVNSSRRALATTEELFRVVPHIHAGHIFAEGIPEQDLLTFYHKYKDKHVVVGAGGVGWIIPGVLKVGAVGGTTVAQLAANRVDTPGAVAVISASGGMTNELMASCVRAGRYISFGLCVGGDRFPYMTPLESCLAAQEDVATEAIVYYGELGGRDEHAIADALRTGILTKPFYAYIAGVVDEAFDTQTQFGHAKALAQTDDESARAKQDVLRDAGAHVERTYDAFIASLENIKVSDVVVEDINDIVESLAHRRATVLTSRVMAHVDDTQKIQKAISARRAIEPTRYTKVVQEMLLGHALRSDLLPLFTEIVYETVMDHGPCVSGAVNTMVTARAGKGAVESLAAGLLTIGPRFGGAINDAAKSWLEGVRRGISPEEFVEERAKRGEVILGIGHKKYRVGMPDPRVEVIRQFTEHITAHPHLDFALSVERVTTSKKGNLILNVDGVIAAISLDILAQEEKYTHESLQELADIEYFNTFFIIPRSVGFLSHYLEQKRNDEGLFRLPEDLVHMRNE